MCDTSTPSGHTHLAFIISKDIAAVEGDN